MSSPTGLWGHCVDGGYYDNTGIQTVMEIAYSLPPDTHPIILLICNEYADTTLGKPIRWYNEISDIVSGYFKAPGTRARSDISMLKTCLTGADVFEFNMSLDQNAVPLGWYLSPDARDSVKTCVRRTLADTALMGSLTKEL
jgi:hypothetical protein